MTGENFAAIAREEGSKRGSLKVHFQSLSPFSFLHVLHKTTFCTSRFLLSYFLPLPLRERFGAFVL